MKTTLRKEKFQKLVKELNAHFNKERVVKHFAKIVIQSKTKAIIKDLNSKQVLVINKEDLDKYLITGGI